MRSCRTACARVTYENGDQIVVDYHQKKAYLNGKQILPLE